MRRTAVAAAGIAVGMVLVCAGTVAAKPTRTFARSNVRRIVETPARERAARESPARVSSTLHNGSSRRSSARWVGSSAASRGRVNKFAAERGRAARAAIVAADRAASRGREMPARGPMLRVSATVERGRSWRAEGAVVREPERWSAVAVRSKLEPSALVNVGGVLRPAIGTMPLRTVEEEVSTPVLLPPLRVSSLYDGQGRLIVPKPLYGSRDILVHQNAMADLDGLDRVQDDADLVDLRREKKLVPLPENETVRVDYRLPENRRYSRPWTAAFLTVLAADFYANFHVPLQVDSAVRTIAVQQRLLRTNGNAAPVSGEMASPHLTGQAIDIAKGGLTLAEIAWMRMYLQPLIDVGKIDVEEEFQQSCFHVSVYRSFVPVAPAHLTAAAARQLPADSAERAAE